MGLTKAARIEFVSNVSRLGLWYATRPASRDITVEDFCRKVTAETPIYRLTELWDGVHHPAASSANWQDLVWQQILVKLWNLWQSSPSTFEAEGYKLLESSLLARVDQDIERWPWLPCGYCACKLPDSSVFGAFAFELADDPAYKKRIAFHIANNTMPQSPFDDMPRLRQELADLVNYVLKEYPEIKWIGCNSWLNSLSRFQILFPPEWVSPPAKPASVSYGYNWWGQFVSRTGGFNFRNAELMRKNGAFPFPAITGRCALESLRDHLTASGGCGRRRQE